LTETGRSGDVAIGKVLGPFGLRGEAKVHAGDPADIRDGMQIKARLPDGSHRALVVASARPHKNRLLVHFEGIADPETVDHLRGAVLLAERAVLPPLPDGAFRDEDLLGMSVVDARLGPIGEVTDVLHYPHADMLVVGARSMLVPMIAAYGVVVDEPARTIATTLPAGFEDL
jgi:16S rRNA processing protein RimM